MKNLLFILVMRLCMGSNQVTAQYTKLLDFSGTNGYYPEGSFTIENEVLYGMTAYGGANQLGCVFKMNIDGTGYTTLLDFSGTADGACPHGSLILSGDILYGMTMMGGTNDMGCIFKIKTDGSGYIKMFDFYGPLNGKYPYGSLLLSGNVLYGMTSQGGNADKGCIFKINTSNSVFTKLFDFTGTSNGSTPHGSFTISGTVLYGMTAYGGGNNKGCIFKINTDGTGYTTLLDFSGTADGERPYGSLILSGNILYGMTRMGGTSNQGCIFSFNTDGTGYTRMYDFDGTYDGAYYPSGSLTRIGNVFYGMTTYGGTYGDGSVFKFDPTHDGFSRILNFNGLGNGSNPQGDLTLSGSTLYGMTYDGGSYDLGVIFKYVLKPATQTSNITFPFVGINVADISWTNGSGEKRAVFVKKGTGTITDPANNITYTASTDWNSKGTQLGTSGYYCVYNGTGNIVSITNLIPGATYTVQAFEYNGEEGNEHYQLRTETGNPNKFQTISLTAIPYVRDNPVQIYSYGSDIYAVIDYCNAKAQLAVFNLSGICIAQSDNLVEGQNRITGIYNPGVYIVRLVLDNELYTQKVVIK